MKQPALFDVPQQVKPKSNPKDFYRSVSDNQVEILRAISVIHNNSEPFELDPTFSKGVFYRGFPEPKYKFDLNPQVAGVERADCRSLPFDDESIRSIMFDPPFVISGDAKKEIPTGVTFNRFSGFSTYAELADLYKGALIEFSRILVPGGLLAFKCQDTVVSRKQYIVHAEIINWAGALGFYCKDIFILTNDRLLHDGRWQNQCHARKAHSYFLVFTKGRTDVRPERRRRKKEAGAVGLG